MTRRSWAVASILVADLFILAAIGSALRKPVTEGLDSACTRMRLRTRPIIERP